MAKVRGTAPSQTFVASFLQSSDVTKGEIPDTATTVLLGECTHGTEEFYRLRVEITKYLIEVRNFKVVLCEADWPFLWHANQYIHRKRKSMFPSEEEGVKVRFPDWMWRNRPFLELIEWMRKRASSDGPYLFGMDCYCKDESKEEVMQFLDRHDRDGLGKAFRRTCYPQDCPEQWPAILAKLQWEIENEDTLRRQEGNRRDAMRPLGTKMFRGCTKLDQFNCEQNIACMISADEYYSKQKLEPPGSRASWNARDQHMMTVVLGLKGKSMELFGVDDVRVVVWAHNSHVGDAAATPMGGVDFTRNEKWNLGQMCRNTLQNVFVVGFYSYAGEVRAAENWGGEGRVMELNSAVPYSLEHYLHSWFPGGTGFFALRRLAGHTGRSDEIVYQPMNSPLNVKYRSLHSDLYFTPDKDPDFSSESASKVAAGNVLGSDELSRMQMRKVSVDPAESFFAIRREVVGKNKTVRLLTDAGLWVTEYTPYGSRRIHCLPESFLDSISGGMTALSVEKLDRIARFPILQRWVGVQYHPEDEVQSHYGEIVVAKCYDLIIFVDQSRALDVNLEGAFDSPVIIEASDPGGAGATSGSSAQTNKRLLIEYRKILKNPIEYIQARPLDSNILEWHFVVTGCQDPYTGGKYHGILEFPDSFPMKPPSIKLLTPSGRFEVNKRICLSMSDFHSESWNPSWTVEKILIGLMSFMYEESTSSIGSILESYQARKRYAADSELFNVQNDIYCELFCSDMQDEELKRKQKSRRLFSVEGLDDADDANACRFCLVNTGDLVSPCACKGTGQYVHLACLRQWQKSVVLTQPTHPRFQTRIDEVCSICETPFKDEFKPVSRRAVIMEYLKSDSNDSTPLADFIRVGNLIVSSRPKSTRNLELIERAGAGEDSTRATLGHFTQAVYLITLYDAKGRRGGGSVLAVNVEQRRRLSSNVPLEYVEDKMPTSKGQVVSPLRVWREKFIPMLFNLFAHRISRSEHGPDAIFSPAFIEHYIGGPVEPAHPFALAEIAHFDEIMANSGGSDSVSLARKLRIKNDIFFGNLDSLLSVIAEYVKLSNLLREHEARSSIRAKAVLKVFWGYASWDGTQLMGEIARCGWGLAHGPANMGILNGNWQVMTTWEQMVDTAVMARESEFSRA